MPNVKFEDNSMECISALDSAIAAFLEEAIGELETQAKRNTRVATSQTKNSWSHVVDEGEHKAYVGNTLENSLWEEFGTGEYAINGDGRKTPWKYQDVHGKWHTTTGKKPSRALQKAFDSRKNAIIKQAERIMKEKMK